MLAGVLFIVLFFVALGVLGSTESPEVLSAAGLVFGTAVVVVALNVLFAVVKKYFTPQNLYTEVVTKTTWTQTVYSIKFRLSTCDVYVMFRDVQSVVLCTVREFLDEESVCCQTSRRTTSTYSMKVTVQDRLTLRRRVLHKDRQYIYDDILTQSS